MVLRDALLPESHWFPYQIHSVRKYKVMISSNLAWLSRYFLSHLLYYIHLQKPCALRSLRRHFRATLHTFSAAQVTSYFCSFIPIPTHPFSDGNPKGCNKCIIQPAEYIQHASARAQHEFQDKAWICGTGNYQKHQPSVNLIQKSLNRMNINKAVDVPTLLLTISNISTLLILGLSIIFPVVCFSTSCQLLAAKSLQ